MVTRARRPGLTAAAIIEAALRLVDKEGVEALTMRRLGELLLVDPMSIYNHVDGKAGLLAGIQAAILGEIELAPRHPRDAAAELLAFAEAYRAMALNHPGAFILTFTQPLKGAKALAPAERVLTALASHGFSPREALLRFNMLAGFLNGALLAEIANRPDLGLPGTDRAPTGTAIAAGPHLAAALAAAEGMSAESAFLASARFAIAGALQNGT